VNALDGVVVVVVLLAGIGGWRFGFVARMLAWCGIAIALVVGFHFVPRVVTSFGGTSADDRVTVAVLFLVLVATLGQTAGFGLGVLAHRTSRATRTSPTWDRVTGATVGVLGVVVVTWILAPALGSAKGWSARQAHGSAVLGLLDDFSPEQPPQFAALGLTISDAPYPSALTPTVEAPDRAPPPESLIPSLVNARVQRSTLLVESTACGWLVRGTGWVVEPGLVVTNAHVVAGESETKVEDSGGREYEADLVLFDPNLDLALLRVRELKAPALPLADAIPGQPGAAYGHPGGGALDTKPALVGKTVPTDVSKMYGPGYARRSVLTFLGRIVPGYSGGPLINGGGDVVGVVFAVSARYRTISYAIPADQVRAVTDRYEQGRRRTARSGGCLDLE
jgi:S1-C subfamily serine protease